jgi:hypothetical protein
MFDVILSEAKNLCTVLRDVPTTDFEEIMMAATGSSS